MTDLLCNHALRSRAWPFIFRVFSFAFVVLIKSPKLVLQSWTNVLPDLQFMNSVFRPQWFKFSFKNRLFLIFPDPTFFIFVVLLFFPSDPEALHFPILKFKDFPSFL
jgi:hypothetical protein